MTEDWWIKFVPNAEPNAEGEWKCLRLDAEPTWDYTEYEGHHVVSYISTEDFEERARVAKVRENQPYTQDWRGRHY